MKPIASMALMLTLGVASVYANEKRVEMRFSGTSENSPTNLQQPDTSNDGDTFAGFGTLGSFTLRNIRAIANANSPSSTCSGANEFFFAETAGGGVFRFEDGSLLYLSLTHGGDCINFATSEAHCTVTFKITGGTGRFQNASGVLTMTETVTTAVSDVLGNPALFGATGELKGTISGVIWPGEAGEGQ